MKSLKGFLALSAVGAAALATACGSTQFEGGSTPRPVKMANDRGSDDARAAQPVNVEEVFTAPGSEDEGMAEATADTPLAPGSWFEQTFTLTSQQFEVEEKANFVQLERPKLEKVFLQGSVGSEAVEEFNQSELGLVDILVVIDNSRSMEEEQAKVASRLPELISQIGDANWQIRIVTTDPSLGCAHTLIRNTDAEPQARFRKAILDLGILGSGDERGVQTAITGLRCGQPWIRPHSNLAVLFVSDEDNCSNGDCSFEPIADNNPATLKDVLASELGGSKRIFGEDARIYGLFKIPGDSSCKTGYADAVVYQKLVKESRGVYGSICDSDYAQTFTQISSDIKSQLKLSFSLSYVPDVDSATLMLDGKTLSRGVDYEIDGRVISFVKPPKARARVMALYRHGGSPVLTEFDLGQAVGKTLEVSLRQAVKDAKFESVDASAYRLDGQKLIFNQEPPAGAEVRVSYRLAEPALYDSFQINKAAIPASIKASIEGQAVGVAYDANSGRVSLERLPQDRQNVVISYKLAKIGSPMLAYTGQPGVTPEELSAVDADSGQALSVSFDGRAFVVEPSDFREGRRVKLSYRVGDLPAGQETLPEALGVSSYTLDAAVGDVPAVAVYVDGVEVKGYKRQGNKLVFDPPLAKGAKVKVQLDKNGKR